jgi:TonB family protein
MKTSSTCVQWLIQPNGALCAIVLACAVALCGCSPSRVTEIAAQYEFEDCVIRYTLEGLRPAAVELYVTHDDSYTWDKVSDGLSGDIGPRIAPGDRLIVVRGIDPWLLAHTKFKLVIDAEFDYAVSITGIDSLLTRKSLAKNPGGYVQDVFGFAETKVTEEDVRDPRPDIEVYDYRRRDEWMEDNPNNRAEVFQMQEEENKEEQPVGFAQEMPQYPGGELQMQKDIMENAPYPEMEKENNIQGKVYVQFVVEKDGSVTNVRVQREVPNGPNLSTVAEEAVRKLRRFTPAKQNGRPVRLVMTIPVNFTLK